MESLNFLRLINGLNFDGQSIAITASEESVCEVETGQHPSTKGMKMDAVKRDEQSGKALRWKGKK
jgi:hypothetical protein